MLSYLRVKIKSLAAEAGIIRREERRVARRKAWAKDHQQPTEALQTEFFGLQEHRKNEVRSEARSSQIAYAFLRQKPYKAMERGPIPLVIRDRAASLAARYGGTGLTKAQCETAILEWSKAA